MKKIFLIVIFLIPSTFAFAQCKIKSKGALFNTYQKNIPKEIDIITKPKVIIAKYLTSGFSAFVKSTDGDFYWVLPLTRNHGKIFFVNEETPTILYLEDGGLVTLNPPNKILGERAVFKFRIYLFYKITREQVEKLATYNIQRLRIYYIAEKEIANTYEDDLGRYFEIEIHSNQFKNNIFDAANCILQYSQHF